MTGISPFVGTHHIFRALFYVLFELSAKTWFFTRRKEFLTFSQHIPIFPHNNLKMNGMSTLVGTYHTFRALFDLLYELLAKTEIFTYRKSLFLHFLNIYQISTYTNSQHIPIFKTTGMTILIDTNHTFRALFH